MMKFQLRIRVGFKEGILDPQAEAIGSSLKRLNFKTLESVHVQKLFLVTLTAESEAQAVSLGREMAQKLLANVVMENYEVEVLK
jgi:phosphoribosylformylglycinamidine synthase PurS subunit